MRYGYFDSEIIGTDSEGMPIFDRAETSDLFRLLFSKLVSNGVLASPSDCFQVVAAEGLNVTVRPGFGMINGAFAYDEAENTLTLEKAPAQYSRIDRIVLRCNYADRLCELVVKTGTVANNPVAPKIVQPAAGDYYELGLATVTVGANVTAVTQANITDTRMDSTVCGFITQLIDHLDTSVFFAQLDQFYTEFVSKTEADYRLSREEYLAMCQDIVDTLNTFEKTAESDFDTWFDTIKGKLAGDIAGALQIQIDNLTQTVFLNRYGLCSKVTTINKDAQGNTTSIEETDQDDSVRAVTTFQKDGQGSTTGITTVITPTEGNYFYTKTTAFETTDANGSKTITESYTQNIKEE
jgi:hypothetical protein|nr:MAG TPA: Receptor Binding Protein [Caudoviricetes sp.]